MRRFINILVLGAFIILSSNYLLAQDMTNQNLYTQNQFLFNPSFAGVQEGITGTMNIKRQFVGIEGAPETYHLGVCGQFLKNSGAGIQVDIRKENLIEYFSGRFSYSHRVELVSDHFLHLGFSAGALEQRLNRNKVKTVNYSDDATLYPDYFNKIRFTSSVGLTYIWNSLNIGITAPNLYVGDTFNSQLLTYAAYSYYFLDNSLKVQPSGLYQFMDKIPDQVDVNLFLQWQNSVWSQVTYRSNKSYVLSLGSHIKNFNVGYSYEINTNNLSHISNGTHELLLIINIKKKDPSL